jgi:hypothetical protein
LFLGVFVGWAGMWYACTYICLIYIIDARVCVCTNKETEHTPVPSSHQLTPPPTQQPIAQGIPPAPLPARRRRAAVAVVASFCQRRRQPRRRGGGGGRCLPSLDSSLPLLLCHLLLLLLLLLLLNAGLLVAGTRGPWALPRCVCCCGCHFFGGGWVVLSLLLLTELERWTGGEWLVVVGTD